jgi:hypothetical protein
MTAQLSVNPFPGLRPFEADEQDLFFGREGQSEEILRRLREQRFVAVVGTSGSGKSSLVRAGLLPYLHGGFLPDAGSHWCVALFRPGANPIKNLATALDDPAALGQTPQALSAPRVENGASTSASAAPQGAAGTSVDEATARGALLLEVTLRRGGLGLIEAVQLARPPPDRQLLIVVDQFEELFRFAEASDRPGRNEDAAAFVKLLLEASRQRELPIYVVVTMRSDYIGDCARYRDLPEAVTSGLYLVPRMTREQWRAAIIEPVRVGRGTIAPRLVVRLLNDVGDDPDQLPILQHALMRMWDHWKSQGNGERPIDIDDYLAIGGMAEALSMHADEAYYALADDALAGAGAIAERLFKALSEKGADNREARRPTKLGTLAKVVDAPIANVVRVIDHFRERGRSFLTSAGGALSHDAVIDISHESLIRGWRRMRRWVEDEAASASIYRRLADTASKGYILSDQELENVLAWRDRKRPNAAWGERYHPGFERTMAFLEKSQLARETDRSNSIKITANRRLLLSPDDLPDNATIQGDQRLMSELFGTYSAKIDWKSLKERFRRFPNSADVNLNTLKEISRIIYSICNHSIVHPAHGVLIVDQGPKQYRPVFSRAKDITKDQIDCEIMLVEDVGGQLQNIDKPLGALLTALKMSVRIRWEIIRPFSSNVQILARLNSQKLRYDLQTCFNNIFLEAEFRGNFSPGDLLDAFEGADKEKLLDLVDGWKETYPKIWRGLGFSDVMETFGEVSKEPMSLEDQCLLQAGLQKLERQNGDLLAMVVRRVEVLIQNELRANIGIGQQQPRDARGKAASRA